MAARDPFAPLQGKAKRKSSCSLRLQTQTRFICFKGLVNPHGAKSHGYEFVLVHGRAMDEDRSAFADQPTWPCAPRRSTHLERDHACPQDRLPVAGLSEGIWTAQDRLQSLRALE